MVKPQLDHDGEIAPVDLAELEDDIRRGRVSSTARLRHAPWTGDDFRRLDQIDALREALDAPDARFVAWLGQRRFPWLSLGLTAIVALAGALQLLSLAVEPQPAVQALVDQAAVGFDELLLDGRWWTPLSSQLVHSGPMHLLPNLAVIAYMGFRVERALGSASLLLVSAAAIAAGTLGIALLEPLPAIGSSVLGFGLWGAVLAIGFRLGDTLGHLRIRGRYGFGSLPAFALLFAATLFNPQATQVGHFLGLLGGFLAALLVPPESLAPRAGIGRATVRNLLLAGLFLLLPMGGGPLLGHAPALLAWPSTRVEVEGAGASLALPRRLQHHELRILGMPAWTTSPNSRAALFLDLATMAKGAELEQALADQWSAALEGELRPLPAPPAPEGWRAFSWEVVDPDSGEVIDRIQERILRRGRSLLRAGWRLDSAGQPTRQALYDHVLATVEVGEPPRLAQARAKLDRNPASPRMQYALASELLMLSEDAGEADALLAGLAQRQDGWAWDAARLRLMLWAEQGRRVEGADLAWVQDWLERAPPQDAGIHGPGVQLLVHSGACEAARAHVAALGEMGETYREAVADCP